LKKYLNRGVILMTRRKRESL